MKKYIAECSDYTLYIMVSESVDLDSRFNCLCLDTGETLALNGWLFTFDEI